MAKYGETSPPSPLDFGEEDEPHDGCGANSRKKLGKYIFFFGNFRILNIFLMLFHW